MQNFPALDRQWPVSLAGGEEARWNPNGKELFFLSPQNMAGRQAMMAVEFQAGSPPRIGRPKLLFEFDPNDLLLVCDPVRCYDVAPGGQHFFAVQRRPGPPTQPVTHVSLIQNWFEELKAKVPTTR